MAVRLAIPIHIWLCISACHCFSPSLPSVLSAPSPSPSPSPSPAISPFLNRISSPPPPPPPRRCLRWPPRRLTSLRLGSHPIRSRSSREQKEANSRSAPGISSAQRSRGGDRVGGRRERQITSRNNRPLMRLSPGAGGRRRGWKSRRRKGGRETSRNE